MNKEEQMIAALVKAAQALQTCDDDYGFNGQDEFRMQVYDEDKVKEALEAIEKLKEMKIL